MRFYVADYLADTRHLTRSEHGAYLLLLLSMWRAGGSLPNDDRRLAALALCTDAEWTEIRPTMMEFFCLANAKLVHKRLTRELAIYDGVVEKRKTADRLGGLKKANKNNGNVVALANHLPSNSRHNQNQNQREINLSPIEGERDLSLGASASPSPADGQASPTRKGMDEAWVAAQLALLEQAEAVGADGGL